MAIYYINPHTTTNGTGTFASPWSLSSSTRTGLTNGDEIRILGVALTSLLTATSYTATLTNQYTLTITAGGGLGADWAAFNVAYIEETGTFFKVQVVSGNTLQLNANSILPIFDTSVTTYTVRRVDTTTYPASSTTSLNIIGSNLNNMTVSDCWTDATTRVTDGTVKTLIHSTSPSAVTFSLNPGTAVVTNCTFNLQNTHIVTPNLATASAGTFCTLRAKESTVDINQLQNSAVITAFATPTFYSCTITFKTLSGSIMSSNSVVMNTTVNITNQISSNIGRSMTSGASGVSRASNLTVNIQNIISAGLESGGVAFVFLVSGDITYNIVNYVDIYANAVVVTVNASSGPVSIAFGSSCVFYYNRRVSTQTTFTNGVGGTSSVNIGVEAFAYISDVPTKPSGWTFTNPVNITSNVVNVTQSASLTKNQASTLTISLPAPNLNTSYPSLTTGDTNFLLVYRDGSSPSEVLAIQNGSQGVVVPKTESPVGTLDAAVYRTTGPSINFFLTTLSTSAWQGGTPARAYKSIKIPVTSGVSYTVTGYIRSDDTSYLAGDCIVYIMDGQTELDTQSMTTSCINAWEQFTLTFTAPQTEEVVFSMGMFYANGNKSYWLDDLTIS